MVKVSEREYISFSFAAVELSNMMRTISTTNFLQRDALYEVEKPYSLRFTPPSAFPPSNIKLTNRNIIINDIRSRSEPLEFSRHGFQLLPFQSQLPYAQFDDDDAVKRIYLREVANLIKEFLGAQKVQIFEHTVRKRHAEFPISTGESYRWNQPTSIAHVDTTISWAVDMARQLNPNNLDIVKERIQCVNFWKPLRGPVKDWPLALCDPHSIDIKSDLEPCDLVYPDYVVENRQLYWSEGLEWWWCSDQGMDEAWIFLQSDTDANAGTKPVPHTAFELGDERGEPRESIEVRALVYYGGFDEPSDVSTR